MEIHPKIIYMQHSTYKTRNIYTTHAPIQHIHASIQHNTQPTLTTCAIFFNIQKPIMTFIPVCGEECVKRGLPTPRFV
eukprot:TRINITY_DN3435_c0_g1_i1.p3 TRINITY_DN3435_c0_g1~~TRINITY_DN3435_c0_g1_i1.p3  ORF type:complete len:78 (-),score=0.14 TRINITY_DN3435_c0_g1_i1:296-529(-)